MYKLYVVQAEFCLHWWYPFHSQKWSIILYKFMRTESRRIKPSPIHPTRKFSQDENKALSRLQWTNSASLCFVHSNYLSDFDFSYCSFLAFNTCNSENFLIIGHPKGMLVKQTIRVFNKDIEIMIKDSMKLLIEEVLLSVHVKIRNSVTAESNLG